MAQSITDADVKTSPRGRKAEIRDDLVKALKMVKPGKPVVLDTEIGPVLTTKERQSASAIIRKHWRFLHGDDSKPSIAWNPESNFAQVRIKV